MQAAAGRVTERPHGHGEAAAQPETARGKRPDRWALHDVVPEHLRPAILLGAFVGLRTAEVVGLRVSDVDFTRGIVRPTLQGAGEELRTDISRTPLPIPAELALELSAAVARWSGSWVSPTDAGPQTSTWAVERAVRSAGPTIDALPDDSRSPTSVTTGRHCSSGAASTSRSSSTGSAAGRRRPRWTPTGTCGTTATSQPEPPWGWCWLLGLRTS